MGKKDATVDYILLVLCSVLSVGLAAVFIILRESCMSKQDNDFVDKYCINILSDNTVRFLASAIVTVAVLLLLWSLQAAVCAFRTFSLETGIQEGVYVALGGLAWKYQLAMFTRRKIKFFWRLVVLSMLLVMGGSQLFQPLLNQAQEVNTVYVKTSNTATVYDYTSYYNVTGDDLLPISTQSSFEQLAQLAKYSGGSNSISTGANQVSTTVVRTGYISTREVSGISNAHLAFKHADTVARVDSVCGNSTTYTMPIATLAAQQPPTATGVRLNTTTDGIARTIVGYAYDLQFPRIAQDDLTAVTRTTFFQCQACDSDYTLQVVETQCTSQITPKLAQFIFTIASQNITVIANQSGSTTVPPTLFSGLIANYTKSLEGLSDIDGAVGLSYNTALLDVFGLFPTGLFNSSMPNFMHSRLSSAVASALNFLWSNYQVKTVAGVIVNGNDFYQHDVPKPLYNPVIRVYVSRGSAWAVVCCFAVPTILLCLLGIIYTRRAKMNIKGSNENALLDNLTAADLDQRRRVLDFPASGCCGFGVVSPSSRAARASNDDADQQELAFNTSLYCVEHDRSSKFGPGHDVAVRLLNHPANEPPLPVHAIQPVLRNVDYC